LVDHLRLRVARHPDTLAFRFLGDGERESDCVSYRQLDRQARAVAALLQGEGLTRERTLLLLPPGLELISTIFGCLYAGTIPVATVVPSQRRKVALDRLYSIAADARPRAVFTTPAIRDSFRSRTAGVAGFDGARWLTSEDVDASREWRSPGLGAESLAFLQYTSGSTAAPRGVMVSHGNLLQNAQDLAVAMDNEGKNAVSWLPLHHDMGLVGVVLQAAYSGMRATLMSPLHFLQRPVRWLQAISRYRSHTSGAPNFAYDLCVRKTTPEQCEGLDLSSWRVAFNGSEPVRAATLERFAEKFRHWGFRPESLYPCYGLAEATLFVSGWGIDRRPVTRAYERTALKQGKVVRARDGDEIQTLVSSGRGRGQEVVIADPHDRSRRRPAQIGEVWIAGDNVARGYWHLPEDSERTFRARLAGEPQAGPFLRTGDIGFLEDGDLFITGRYKDLIIMAGSNHYPQDVEQTVEEGDLGVSPGGCAAFSIEVDDAERLVVVAELRRGNRLAETTKAIRRLVAEEHDLRVHAVKLIRLGTLPKTTSGKVQRHACSEAYLDGTLASWEPEGETQGVATSG
jgi:acyl-CoA synthetase (AMP-forming)/AMP-acid ligase II